MFHQQEKYIQKQVISREQERMAAFTTEPENAMTSLFFLSYFNLSDYIGVKSAKQMLHPGI